MNIEIKGYDCVQHDPISEWIPEDIYDIDVWLTFSIGLQGQNRADYFKLKESEYRTVNGLKVLYLRYIANTKGLDFEYQTYAFLTDNGYCSVTSYAFAKNFDQNKAELDRFLNGLVEVKKAETVEVYETPPPPAKIKSKN